MGGWYSGRFICISQYDGEEMTFLFWFAIHPWLGTMLVILSFLLIDSIVVAVLNTVIYIGRKK